LGVTGKMIEHRIVFRSRWWVLQIEGKDYPFPSAADAIEMAITLANASGLRGRPASVVVRTRNGGWRSVWVYGCDSHPRGYGQGRKI